MDNKYDHLKEKLNQISINAALMTGDDGLIKLDPNNWDHLKWWQDNEEIEEFMDENRRIIEDFSKFEGVTIKDAVDILFE